MNAGSLFALVARHRTADPVDHDHDHDHASEALELAERCHAEPADLSNKGLRIASVFIILAGSLAGALLPILLSRASKRMHVPKATFFVLKYVGTGVIIATAWMHLLSPAVDALHDECLADRLGMYDWAFAIGLMTVMFMFLVELLATHASRKVFVAGPDAEKGHDHDHHANHHNTNVGGVDGKSNTDGNNDDVLADRCVHNANRPAGAGPDERFIPGLPDDVSYPPGGQDHLGHARHHQEHSAAATTTTTTTAAPSMSAIAAAVAAPPKNSTDVSSDGGPRSHDAPAPYGPASGRPHDSIAGQLTSIFILEFGVVFHSIFIGLALASSSELTILLIVIFFHQTLEGLGLGSRLAIAPWPARRRWVPYALGCLYAVSTPIAIAVGINAQPKDHAASLLVQGIFDAIAAGILMYTGLVELLAHEFMFNPHMRNSPLRVQLFAYGCVAFGAGVMALLGRWA